MCRWYVQEQMATLAGNPGKAFKHDLSQDRINLHAYTFGATHSLNNFPKELVCV